MRINFFDTGKGLDKNAISAGVYHIELKNREGKSISLYIGESYCMAQRCSIHLREFLKRPEYLGLKHEDLNNSNLILEICVVKVIKMKRSENIVYFKECEKLQIDFYKPLTQLRTSDRMISPISKKCEIVRTAMFDQGMCNK